MRALVVYESMFGNTKTIAEAVAGGLSTRLSVDLVEVGAATGSMTADVGLLVVGGPTHAFGMSRPGTRQSAAQQAGSAPLVSGGIGLREWLDDIHSGGRQVAAAAFDTRVPRVPGSAANAAHKRLRRLGFQLIARPASFYVVGSPGPLRSGEEDRARRWGEQLGADFTARQPGRVS